MALTQMLLKALLLAKRIEGVATANDGAILLSKMVEKALLHLLKKNCSC
jgi:glucose/arabinose dehydrogenase